MNIPTFYALLAPEIGLVASLGVYAARHAMRRQEIRHAAMFLEHQSALFELTQSQPVALLSSPVECAVVESDLTAPGTSIKIDTAEAASAFKEWLPKAREVAKEVAATSATGEACIDDIWEQCPLPDGIEKRAVALAFPRHEWKVVRYTRSRRRAINHGRSIAVFMRKQAEAA